VRHVQSRFECSSADLIVLVLHDASAGAWASHKDYGYGARWKKSSSWGGALREQSTNIVVRPSKPMEERMTTALSAGDTDAAAVVAERIKTTVRDMARRCMSKPVFACTKQHVSDAMPACDTL